MILVEHLIFPEGQLQFQLLRQSLLQPQPLFRLPRHLKMIEWIENYRNVFVQKQKLDVLLRKKLDVEPLKKPLVGEPKKNSVDSKKKLGVPQRKPKLLLEPKKRPDNALKKPQE